MEKNYRANIEEEAKGPSKKCMREKTREGREILEV